MWKDVFEERIRISKIKKKEIQEIMGYKSYKTLYSAILNNSIKLQDILKVYKFYNWDLNELKEESDNVVNDMQSTYVITKKPIENNIKIDKIELLYEKRLEEKDAEIKYLRKQLDKLIKNNNAMEGGTAASA